ncbi:MAG TPA: LacI family DNA-binding transcriptional regulator [Thermoanaerobaculia bacterium]|nr:LacI family DNA-binding transcriptional regulator [Thermoanaerobaculia bacterium]
MPTAPQTRRVRRRRRSASRATIHDVAARAGVSVATVSRVLNRKNVVREETSRQVRDAARSLDYVPNVAARALSARRSQTIGVLLPDVHGEFFSEVIRGIDSAAWASGYHILVSGWHSDLVEMLQMIGAMRGRVDGLVVMAPDVAVATLNEQLRSELPLVLLSSSGGTHPAIAIDNYGGARAVMRHLASLGHTRIAFIRGPSHNVDARERLRGFRRASGLAPGESVEFDGDFGESSGREAALRIAQTRPRPTAVFAANDSMAVGALTAFAELGLAIPDDIAVVGFDDIPIARYVDPPLTTVRVDIADVGRRAVSILLDSLAHPRTRSKPRRECVPTSLVIRKSCGSELHNHLRARRKGE